MNSLRAQCMCSVELSLKNPFITRVSVVTDAYLCNSKWYPKDFLKAILLLQVQTAVFLFTLCLMSTLLEQGKS